jgi:hypothetical protein
MSLFNFFTAVASGGGEGGGSVPPSFPANTIPVIIDLGQSQSGARGESNRIVLTSYSQTPTDAQIYAKVTYDAVDNGVWEQTDALSNTSDNRYVDHSTFKFFGGEISLQTKVIERLGIHHSTFKFFGGEISLQTKVIERLGIPCYYIKVAFGSTFLAQVGVNNWNPSSVGSLLDQFLNNFFDVAIPKLQAANPTKNIKILCVKWKQGEADSEQQTYIDEYQSNFLGLMSKVRAHDTLLNNVPFIVTKLHFYENALEGQINTIFDNVAGNPANNCHTVNYSDMPKKVELTTEQKGGIPPTGSDDNHMSYLGQIADGERTYDKLVELGII